MMKIERIDPLITIDQTLELVHLGCGARSIEMEKAVAMALQAILCPPYMVNDSNVDQPGVEK